MNKNQKRAFACRRCGYEGVPLLEINFAGEKRKVCPGCGAWWVAQEDTPRGLVNGGGWISVEVEEKPKHGQECLCLCTIPGVSKHVWTMVLTWYAYGSNGYVDRPHFTDEGTHGMTVTHWMPIPEPPEEVKNGKEN